MNFWTSQYYCDSEERRMNGLSLTNYLGCNFILPTNNFSSNNMIIIGNNFSDHSNRKNVRKHMTTQNIYEISTSENVGICLDRQESKISPHNYQKELRALKALLNMLDNYLDNGDYCELYTCWVGEELEERNIELDQTIILGDLKINNVEIKENTLITIRK